MVCTQASQRTGSTRWARRCTGQPVGAGVRGAVVVGDDRGGRFRERDRVEDGPELVRRRRHERRVERAADRERPGPADAHALGCGGRPRPRPSGVPPTTIWPGALRLAGQASPSAAAQAASAWSASAPRRASMPPGRASAARWVASARAAAMRTPSSNADGAAGDQRGDLAERVAGEGDRPAHRVAGGLPGHEREEQDRQLRVAGAGQVGVGVEEQGGEGDAERGLGSFDHMPGGVVEPVPAGASLLAALPGEHHGWGHRASPSLRMIDGQTTVQQQWFPVPAGNFDISRCRLRELV